jgi:DNA-3-methyladenine glycosylase
LKDEGFAPVGRDFFDRDVLTLARALVGCVLVHETAEGTVAGRIVETEAYRGPEDLAAHSARGRRTARVAAMWGPAGHAYVYFIYGMHWAFNVVAGGVDEPHAILVRALEPVVGRELMASRRGLAPDDRNLTSGPGKLCRAMAIDKQQYGAPLFEPPLYLSKGTRRAPLGRGPRVGIDYAGVWVERPWRFWERGNPWVSVRPRE